MKREGSQKDLTTHEVKAVYIPLSNIAHIHDKTLRSGPEFTDTTEYGRMQRGIPPLLQSHSSTIQSISSIDNLDS